MKRILVTGGAGFLGAHVCARLLDRGDAVTCLDDFSTGARERIAPFMERDDFALVTGDVCDPPVLGAHDSVVHLACPASPKAYRERPLATAKAAAFGTLRMLEKADHWGARLLHASTSEIYGEGAGPPHREDRVGALDPLGPRACYQEAKRFAETLCDLYARERSLDVRIVRIFNTYGPGMASGDGRVVANFVTAAISGAPLRLEGGGAQTRAFCYVDDLVEGLLRALDHPGPWPGPVNLGSGEEVSVADLAARVCALTRPNAPMSESPPAPGDTPRRRPDVARADALLDWRAETPLEEGLRRTIAWFRSEM